MTDGALPENVNDPVEVVGGDAASGGLGGLDLGSLLGAAQNMQAQMLESQQRIGATVVEGQSGGGAVTIAPRPGAQKARSKKVDALVTAAGHQQVIGIDTIQTSQCAAQRLRLRIRIAAQGTAGIGQRSLGRFVGVEPDFALHSLAASRRVAGELAKVVAQQFLRGAHAGTARRNCTARAWACRPSASARVMAHGPMLPMPTRLAVCTVRDFMKLDTDKSLQARAAPPVGKTWLLPEQ